MLSEPRKLTGRQENKYMSSRSRTSFHFVNMGQHGTYIRWRYHLVESIGQGWSPIHKNHQELPLLVRYILLWSLPDELIRTSHGVLMQTTFYYTVST